MHYSEVLYEYVMPIILKGDDTRKVHFLETFHAKSKIDIAIESNREQYTEFYVLKFVSMRSL